MVFMGEVDFILFVMGVFASRFLAFGFGMFFDDGLHHFENGGFQLVYLVDKAILLVVTIVVGEGVIYSVI